MAGAVPGEGDENEYKNKNEHESEYEYVHVHVHVHEDRELSCFFGLAGICFCWRFFLKKTVLHELF